MYSSTLIINKGFVCVCVCSPRISYNTMKVFCPNCGNKTLKRVAMMRDEDGKVHYYFSKRPLNTRGMKVSLSALSSSYSMYGQICNDGHMSILATLSVMKTLFNQPHL